MFAVKKFAPLLALLAISCGKHNIDNSDYLSSVTFFNSSSYSVTIHTESFSGPVLVDKLASGMSYSTTLNPSDNHGIGSVFSVEYWILVANYSECSCGDVWINGIDPTVQIPQNIEVGNNDPITIPQPKSLELNETFLKIRNTSDNSFELNLLGSTFRQAGNGELSVPSGKIGIYKFESRSGETEIKGYTITQVLKPAYPFPEFTAKNGYIYNFKFDGNSIEIIGEQKIIK